MALILNKAQAEAVYSAMCALNNVEAIARTVEMQNKNGHKVRVRCDPDDGTVHVSLIIGGYVRERDIENYPDQSAFAAAYGLQQG